VKHSGVVTDPDPPNLIESGSASNGKLNVDFGDFLGKKFYNSLKIGPQIFFFSISEIK
jgi:hypothetical protein